jgi:hypothetical protein
LLDDGRISICTNNEGSGSGRPKNLRIRIHNTDFGANEIQIENINKLGAPSSPPPKLNNSLSTHFVDFSHGVAELEMPELERVGLLFA